MSKFTGSKCDSCGAIVDNDDRTRRVVKLDGPVLSGEYTEDFCRDCVAVPDHVELKPLRRRRVAAQPAPTS